MKKLIITLFITINLFADSIDVIDFESDIFSKYSKLLKKITISLHLNGNDLQINSYKIQDGLNIVLSSFYLEDLITSQGKESFKNSLKKYLKERYHIKLDSIYIIKLVQIENIPDIDKLIEALKENGCCQKNNKLKKLFENE